MYIALILLHPLMIIILHRLLQMPCLSYDFDLVSFLLGLFTVFVAYRAGNQLSSAAQCLTDQQLQLQVCW